MVSKDEFSRSIRALAMLVPKFAPKFEDPECMGLWWKTFEAFDRGILFEAFGVCKRRCTEFPSIHEIIRVYEACGGKEPQPAAKELPGDKAMEKILIELGLKKPGTSLNVIS